MQVDRERASKVNNRFILVENGFFSHQDDWKKQQQLNAMAATSDPTKRCSGSGKRREEKRKRREREEKEEGMAEVKKRFSFPLSFSFSFVSPPVQRIAVSN